LTAKGAPFMRSWTFFGN